MRRKRVEKAQEPVMSYKKANIILSAALALLLGLLWLMSALPEPVKAGQEDLESTYALMFDSRSGSDVSTLSLVNDRDKILLYSDESGSFRTDALSAEELSAERVSAFLESIAGLCVNSEVIQPDSQAELAAVMEEYGISDPAAILQIQWNDGAASLLVMGEEMANGSYYAYLDGIPAVLTVPEEYAQRLLVSSSALRDLSFFRYDNSGQSKLEQITISNSAGNISFRLRDTAADGSLSYYRMLEPVEAEISWQNARQLLLEPLSATDASAVLDTKGGLSGYDAMLTLVYGGQTLNYYFAAYDDNTVLSWHDGSELTYALNRESVSFVYKDYLEFMGGCVYQGNAADIASIKVSSGAIEYALALEGSGENLSGRVGDAAVERELITGLMTKLNSLYIEGSADSSGAAALTVEINYRGGRPADILSFSPGEGRSYTASVNGSGYFAVYADAYEQLLAAFEQIEK